MPTPKKRKTGPKRGLYERILQKDGCPRLHRGKKWRHLSPLQRSRTIAVRALWRSREYKEKYLKLSKFVKSIREAMKLNQQQFAQGLGVSHSSVKRWEYCSGREPKIETMNKLRELAKRHGITGG